MLTSSSSCPSAGIRRTRNGVGVSTASVVQKTPLPSATSAGSSGGFPSQRSWSASKRLARAAENGQLLLHHINAGIPVDITAAGRALRAELHQFQHDRLAELLDTLSPHDEATLGLALRVALPFIEQLTRHAAQNPHSRPAFASA